MTGLATVNQCEPEVDSPSHRSPYQCVIGPVRFEDRPAKACGFYQRPGTSQVVGGIASIQVAPVNKTHEARFIHHDIARMQVSMQPYALLGFWRVTRIAPDRGQPLGGDSVTLFKTMESVFDEIVLRS